MVEVSRKMIDGKSFLLLNSYGQKCLAIVKAVAYRQNDGGHRRLARVIKHKGEVEWGLWVYPNERRENK